MRVKPSSAMLLILLLLGCTEPAKTGTGGESPEKAVTGAVIGEAKGGESLTQSEIARITAEETERITEEITKSETARLTGTSMAGSGSCDVPPMLREFDYAQYYTGPLVDTHVHMPVASETVSAIAIQSGFEDMPHRGDIPIDYIACLFEREGIAKAFGFFMAPSTGLDFAVSTVRQDVGKHPGRFVPFFMPPLPLQSAIPSAPEVQRVLQGNPGFYQGYGEARFDFNLGTNAHPEDEYFHRMYQLADEHNLIVQIHPNRDQLDALERLLQRYPNVLFLAHVMPYAKQEIGKLMETYPNLYYSLDAEIHYLFGYHTVQDNRGPAKEEYLTFIRERFDAVLQEGLRDWKPIIEEHPDRFTWGSDRWYRWHFDPEVGSFVTEFGRTFIGHLDPAVQAKIAHENAERMLAER